MFELAARTPLSNQQKSVALKKPDYFSRFEDGYASHTSNRDELGSDEFCFKRRLPILNQHRDHLTQVGVKLIQGISPGMSAWETGNKTYKKSRLRTFFNHRSKCSRGFSIPRLLTEGNIWLANVADHPVLKGASTRYMHRVKQ